LEGKSMGLDPKQNAKKKALNLENQKSG